MKKILIIDDQEIYLNSIKFALHKHFDVDTALSKEGALLKLETYYDIALIDIRLDEADENNTEGLELLAWIKKYKPEISVFVMSAHREFQFAEQSINLGALNFFRKPIDIISLTNIIKEKALK